MVLRRRPQRDDAAREETVKPTSRASNLASLSDVAAALEPLRAASNQAGLAGAVCSLLVSTVAVVCRVDRLEADAPVVMIARAAAEGRPDVATPDGDLAGDAAAAGVFDVVPDSGRRLSWVGSRSPPTGGPSVSYGSPCHFRQGSPPAIWHPCTGSVTRWRQGWPEPSSTRRPNRFPSDSSSPCSRMRCRSARDSSWQRATCRR